MILRAKDGVRGRIVDLDTGKDLKRVIWWDTDTGHFECYQSNPDGTIKTDQHGNHLTLRGIGRFRFVPQDKQSLFKFLEGAERCARCGTSLTLPRDDLCAPCRASQDPGKQARTNGADRNLMRVERISALSLNNRCSEKGCSRVACWIVADEAPVSFIPGRLFGKVAWFQRGITVGRRFWCDHHYRPPRLLDSKGEVISEIEGTGPDVRKRGVTK